MSHEVATCADVWCDRPAKYEVSDQMWCGIHARMHKNRATRNAERLQRCSVAEANDRRSLVLLDRFAAFGITKIAYESTRLGPELVLTEVQAEAILTALEAKW